ncbi:MAG: sel1 repeat family protein [Robiginitomaculum sp.]|nr:sel1 repeat family protein [Robiginitomaculum sp.]
MPEDHGIAIKWFRKAADQGYAEGQYRLAMMYDKDWGISKSRQKEMYWTKQAAAQGHGRAKYSLSLMKKLGYDLVGTYVTPVDTSPQAYFKNGVRAVNAGNKPQAVNSFRFAAEKGHAPSQAELGAAYMHGYGLEVDFYQSRTWLKKSAAQGDAGGYFLLGNIYYCGLGVTKHTKNALEWYHKAAAKGHEQAIQAVKSIESAQLQTAAALASERTRVSGSWKDGQREITQRIIGENACKQRSAYLYKYGGTYNPNEGYYVDTGANAKFVLCD